MIPIPYAGQPDEDIAAGFLRGYGLDPQPFTKKERNSGKTPDFRVLLGANLAFFCEVKSPYGEVERGVLERAEREGASVDVGQDASFNRIAAHILKATQQFDAVNPGLVSPNVLIFVDHDPLSNGFHDLISTLTGNFHATDGSREHIYGNVSDGKLLEAKLRVHLYWWIETYGSGRRRCFLNEAATCAQILCQIFGIDQSTLSKV